jgi:asparagine synthase (glutamine-hydrolysing)
MQRALTHRGRHGLGAPVTMPRCTLGVGVPRHDRRLGGIAASRRTRTVVAIAGRLPLGFTVADVVSAVDSCGARAVEHLAGEWIVAVATPDRLTVLRDPAGARTAYWARHRDRILVAVEPKGIHTIPSFRREIDAAALAQYLTFSFVPGARTMLAGLYELPAGHRLDVELDDGTTTVSRFFDDHASRAGAQQCHERDWIAATRSAVETAVTERLPDDEPVVTFLSGGLDSSIVTAVAAARRRAAGLSPPVTLSLHFGAGHPNELEYARQTAALARTDHHEIEVRADDLHGRLARMVWHLDEPIGDPVTIGNFALAGSAATHA